MAKILGIEIGTVRIKIAVAEEKAKKIKIYQCLTIPLPDGMIDDGIVKDSRSIGTLIRDTLKKEKIHLKKAVFTVASSRIANREVTIPFVKDSNIQSLVEMNSRDYFPIDISQYQISYVKTGQITEDHVKYLKLLVVAAPKGLLRAYEEIGREAGLTVTAIDYIGNSLFQAATRKFPKGNRMLLQVEAKNTLALVLKDGELSMQRNVGHGLSGAIDYLREEAFEEQGLTCHQALELLEKDCYLNPVLDMPAAVSGSSESVIQNETTEALRYLCGNLVRIMDYYLSRHREAEIDGITLVGDGSGVKGLRELLSNELGIDVDILENADTKTSLSEGLYLAVAGAIIKPLALKNKKESVSVASFFKKGGMGRDKTEQEESRAARLALIISVCVSLILGAVGIGSRLYHSIEQGKLEKELASLQPVEQIYEEYTNVSETYQGYESLDQYTKTNQNNLLLFLGELEQKMPKEFTIYSFQSSGSTVAMDVTVASKEAAAQVLMQLRTFESLSDVTTTGITEEGGNGAVQMSVTCTFRDETDLSSEETQTAGQEGMEGQQEE